MTELLRKSVEDSEGTAKFLEIMRDVISAYMAPNLTPLERIRKIWHSLFLIRIWRGYVLSTKNLTLKKNFWTQYCYICIELNAHSLVLLLLHMKKNDMSKLFKPDLFSSQPCESLFRTVRSFTSTYSTVVNCSVKEILERMNKIQLQGDIATQNAGNFIFPRVNATCNGPNMKIEMPTLEEIYDQIEKCKAEAVKYAKEVGLIKNKKKNTDTRCKVPPYIPRAPVEYSNSEYSAVYIDEYLYEKFKVALLLKSGSYSNYAQKFRDVSIEETCPYVEINSSTANENKRIVVKKSFLCWLLRTNSPKLSSDRLARVKSKIKNQPKSKIHCEYARRFRL